MVNGLKEGKLTPDKFNLLPKSGNPYLTLKNIITPDIPCPPTPQASWKRIILISNRTESDTQTTIADATKTQVSFVHVDSRPNRFSKIRSGDLVVYCTAATSHSAYYLARHLAKSRGADFLHTAHSNRDIIAQSIIEYATQKRA